MGPSQSRLFFYIFFYLRLLRAIMVCGWRPRRRQRRHHYIVCIMSYYATVYRNVYTLLFLSFRGIAWGRMPIFRCDLELFPLNDFRAVFCRRVCVRWLMRATPIKHVFICCTTCGWWNVKLGFLTDLFDIATTDMKQNSRRDTHWGKFGCTSYQLNGSREIICCKKFEIGFLWEF